MTTETTTNPKFTVIPLTGGRANVHTFPGYHDPAVDLPMTPLAKGGNRWFKTSKDGVYEYHRDEFGGWFVKHVPSGTWLTDIPERQATLFGSCAHARRHTYANPIPATAKEN